MKSSPIPVSIIQFQFPVLIWTQFESIEFGTVSSKSYFNSDGLIVMGIKCKINFYLWDETR